MKYEIEGQEIVIKIFEPNSDAINYEIINIEEEFLD
jgi:hypothetical protein